MTTKLFLPLTLLALAASVRGAPLSETTAVQTQPDSASPIITYLKAGAEPIPSPDSIAIAPAGWMAIIVPGPFEGYVANKDLTKSLDVRPGSAVRLAPQADAGVLATADKGDSIVITGLRGRWTQVKLDKKLVGFIHMGPVAATAPVASMQDVAPAPPAPAAATSSSPGMEAKSDGDTAPLPRFFDGKVVSSKKAFAPRRPYDWQLNDDSGNREAYIDGSKLTSTQPIESYVGRDVQVFGSVKPVPGSKDFVVIVESLQVK